ncbi:fumarylacetoacetase [Pseudomonas sp. HR96]|uniref:fumarylacetoacetase n=1 Tax=Pseudomonas sp. HR96 TaxID=1027966 RepID=UPI002A755D9E|nr:fumarylacetoacetase [Pseudomonas sp. HR96]WPP00719.1 fumarylacetoacetase [Pseudomonas sp. HR96]
MNGARSWLETANGHADFPLQNLPYGVFSHGGAAPRVGVAIGDSILDLPALLARGLLYGLAADAVAAMAGGTLNAFFAMGQGPRLALRQQLQELLEETSQQRARVECCLLDSADCSLHMPARVGDYTDFYVGIEHAKNVGALFRPDNPLLPNYKFVPIGYHGRASTLRASGHPVPRPRGQSLPAGQGEPTLAATARLDFELELGVWIGPGNALGEPLPIGRAGEHVAGYCLLNDWSARDIQAWEYQPLGPFLSKSFITSISPWVVTPEALAPFRCAQPSRPHGDPQPLPYLWDEHDQARGALAIDLQVWISTAHMRSVGLPAERLSQSSTLAMYWTVAQLLAHHSSNGCQLQPGDLFGSGTLSGAQPGQYGSLLEMTQGGKVALQLASGEARRFLEDGDEIILRGRCHREGYASIGFGECRGRVQGLGERA